MKAFEFCSVAREWKKTSSHVVDGEEFLSRFLNRIVCHGAIANVEWHRSNGRHTRNIMVEWEAISSRWNTQEEKKRIPQMINWVVEAHVTGKWYMISGSKWRRQQREENIYNWLRPNRAQMEDVTSVFSGYGSLYQREWHYDDINSDTTTTTCNQPAPACHILSNQREFQFTFFFYWHSSLSFSLVPSHTEKIYLMFFPFLFTHSILFPFQLTFQRNLLSSFFSQISASPWK